MSPPRERPQVDVVVVTYHAERYLDACLDSVLASRGVTLSVWVVDNASSDGTLAHARAREPRVQVVERAGNDGFAVATNDGIRRGHAPWVLALNPDTELEPDALARVISAMEQHPDAGVAGCRLVQADGSLDHAAKRSQPDPLSSARYLLAKAGLPVTSAYTEPSVGERDVAWVGAVNGAFMLMRRDVLDQIGLFDERYWMYAEDLDLCRRFTDHGRPVLYVGTVDCIHLKGAASGQYRGLRLNWHFHHSMAQYYRKFDAGHSPLTALVLLGIYARFVVSAAVSALRRLR